MTDPARTLLWASLAIVLAAIFVYAALRPHEPALSAEPPAAVPTGLPNSSAGRP